MSDNFPCGVHTEQIKNLTKKVDNMDRLTDSIHSLDKTMAVQTKMLESITEHNAKQDKRMDEQHEINIKISANLTELNEGQKVLNKRVGKLEERVDGNEEKNSIDIRDIQKKWYTDFLSKYGIPIALISVLGMEIFRFIKG